MKLALRTLIGAALLIVAAGAAQAQTGRISVTDVAGRTVEVTQPVRRMILGEGRQIYFVAALDTEDPFKRVVGWRDDFAEGRSRRLSRLSREIPGRSPSCPTFGGMKEGTFDIEQAVALKPDVIVMNIEAKTATDEAELIEKLAKVGIPVVYVDFREKPVREHRAEHAADRQAVRQGGPGRGLHRLPRASRSTVVTERLAKANPASARWL